MLLTLGIRRIVLIFTENISLIINHEKRIIGIYIDE